MQVNLTGHHVEITDPLREYVNTKMERIVRHFDGLTDARCVLTVEKLRHKAEGTLLVAGNQLHAESVAEDMYAAIDGLVDRLDRQVRKHKEKLTDHHVKEAHRQRLA